MFRMGRSGDSESKGVKVCVAPRTDVTIAPKSIALIEQLFNPFRITPVKQKPIRDDLERQ
jgi:hypothetical protein